MNVLLLVAAGGLLGFAGGVVAGRWAWLALVVLALVIYISVGTGADVPPDWMATAIPVVPFAFMGVGIGIGVRRALHGDTPRAPVRFSLRPESASGSGSASTESVNDLAQALGVLSLMLDVDFDGSEAYRRQFGVATLTRHATGCSIAVDRSRAAPAEFDAARPGARLPVEAIGHGGVRIWLHGFEGYLDDLELLNASQFPDPPTVQIRST